MSSQKLKTNFSKQIFDDPSIYKDNAKLVKVKLSLGANPNYIRKSSNPDRRPAVSHAIAKNYSQVLSIVQIFLNDERFDVNAPDNNGYVPIMYPCRYGYVNDTLGAKLIALFLKHSKIKVNLKSKSQCTALYLASQNNFINCVRALLKSPSIDPNILSKGETPLHVAQRKGHKLIVTELLKDGRADPTISDSNGKMVITQIEDPDMLEHIPRF